MTDVIPSLLNLHVHDVSLYEPRTFQRQFPLCSRIWKLFSEILQASNYPIWLEGLFAKQWLCTCDTDFGTFLCHPLQNNNVKWPNSKFYVSLDREHSTVNFLFSTWTVDAVLYTVSAPELFRYIRQIERIETIANVWIIWKWHFPWRCRRGC